MSDDHKAIVAAEVQMQRRPEQRPQPRQEQQVDFATVLTAIIDRGLTPEMLREVLTIQNDFAEAERRLVAEQSFTEALVGLKADLPPVVDHDKKVNFGQTRFNYTTLARLNAVVTPIMCKHGFTHMWLPSFDGKREVGITCQLRHVDGHVVEAFLPSVPSDKKGMSQAQAVTATQTTLKRNTLLSLLGLATADMDEQHGPRGDDTVDMHRNISARDRLKSEGHLEAVEAELERGWKAWTTADCNRIGEIVRGLK